MIFQIYYVKKKNKIDLMFTFDTKFIHEYFDLFVEKSNDSINSFENFKKNNKGYLKLNIQKIVKKEDLQRLFIMSLNNIF